MFGYEEVNWKEVAAELWHGFRHLSPQKVLDWLTDGYGVRLIGSACIVLGLWMTGCSTQPLDPIATGTEHAVTVSRVNSLDLSNMSRPMTSELAAAERHCARHGRVAQFAGKVNDWSNAYNCVKP